MYNLYKSFSNKIRTINGKMMTATERTGHQGKPVNEKRAANFGPLRRTTHNLLSYVCQSLLCTENEKVVKMEIKRKLFQRTDTHIST